jgi:hypothetical protein
VILPQPEDQPPTGTLPLLDPFLASRPARLQMACRRTAGTIFARPDLRLALPRSSELGGQAQAKCPSVFRFLNAPEPELVSARRRDELATPISNSTRTTRRQREHQPENRQAVSAMSPPRPSGGTMRDAKPT